MVTQFNYLFRLLDFFSSKSFCKYAAKYCKQVGRKVHVSYNWKLVNPEFITIGNNFSAGTNLRLQVWTEYNKEKTTYCRQAGEDPELIIGENVSFVSNCQISCVNKIIIGDGCLLGDNVFITDNFHGSAENHDELLYPPALRHLTSKGKVVLGANCWVGRNVCIMPGVSIGEGCIIGANSVVTKSVPSYTVVAGTPAKVIRILKKD